MTKRARITALITTLCVCISLFVVGVLAATTASLSVTSTLKFSADGVYVMVDASLKQGADVETAAVLSGEGAPTQPTFKAYSYPRESGQDYPNGEPSTTHFVNESGAQASTWAIGDITYTSENVVVVYEFLVSNYSEFEVTGTVEGISDALASYTDQLSITTYTGTASSDATATSSPTYTFNIPARTSETTPGQACYKIAVTLNKFTSDITTETIQIDVTFERPPEPVYEYFTYSGNAITGLSDTYKNLETKPETLVIPSTDGKGNNITSIADSYSSSTFQDLESSNVIIQEGIGSIGMFAFSNCVTLTSITFPSDLTSIGAMAFFNCSGLIGKLIFPEGIISIGVSAFRSCSGLTSVSLPKSLTNIGASAFSACSGLTGTLTIPEKVTNIEDGVFLNCSGFTGTLIIPEGVTSIGSQAFYGCRGFTNVNFPTTLTSIEDYAFYGCRGLTGALTIPEGVVSIGDSAFWECNGLTSITLPSTLTSIERWAFEGCNNLNSMNYLGTILQWLSIKFGYYSSNPLFYTNELYIKGEKITDLIVPEGVTSIGSYTFSGCSSLTSINFPSSLTSIGEYAFRGCSGLTGDLVIPEGVTSIGEYAIGECNGLTSISFPSTLISIGEYAFIGCSGLTNINFSTTLISIGYSAFSSCSNLTSVTFADPNGWWYTSDETATSGTSITEDLSDPAVAATCLKTTYRNYYWKKS